MPLTKSDKEQLRTASQGRFARSNAVLVAEYSGLKVEDLTRLRVALRKVDAEFRVAKNRVVKGGLKAENSEFAALSDMLKGAVGVVHFYGDAAAGSKAALEFEKDNELFKVRGGFMNGELLAPADIKAMSDLPSREVLLARIVGTIVGPHRGLVTVLSGVSRNLVQVLNAIKEKKT